MELSVVIQILLGAIVSGVMIWVKSVSGDLRTLQKQLADTREEYVKKDDLKELKVEINTRFDKLEDLIQKRNN